VFTFNGKSAGQIQDISGTPISTMALASARKFVLIPRKIVLFGQMVHALLYKVILHFLRRKSREKASVEAFKFVSSDAQGKMAHWKFWVCGGVR
jgi:hypothetical protein